MIGWSQLRPWRAPCPQILAGIVTFAVACDGEVQSTGALAGAAGTPITAPEGWEIRELARVGNDDGDVVFEYIADIEIDGLGNVYVLDYSAAHVVVLDRSGRPIRVLGRPGGGPGEFKRPSGLAVVPEEHLWVADAGNARYTIFGPDGTLIATSYRADQDRILPTWNAFTAHDGTIYEPHAALRGRRQPVFVGIRRSDDLVIPVDTIDRRVTELPPVWSVGGMSRGGLIEGGRVPVPFSSVTLEFLDASRGYWVGKSDQPRIVKLSPRGDTSVVVRLDFLPDRPVEPIDIDDAVRQLRERFGDALQVERDLVPRRMPYWQTFLVDDSDRIWVQRFERYQANQTAHPSTWDVFSESGAHLGAIILPVATDPRPAIRGNLLAGVLRDSLGVNQVIIYSLRI